MGGMNPLMALGGMGMPYSGLLGAKYKGGAVPLPVVEPPPTQVLNGLRKVYGPNGELVMGMSATISQQNTQVPSQPLGLMGVLGQMGMFPGFGKPPKPQGPQELQAEVEFVLPGVVDDSLA